MMGYECPLFKQTFIGIYRRKNLVAEIAMYSQTCSSSSARRGPKRGSPPPFLWKQLVSERKRLSLREEVVCYWHLYRMTPAMRRGSGMTCVLGMDPCDVKVVVTQSWVNLKQHFPSARQQQTLFTSKCCAYSWIGVMIYCQVLIMIYGVEPDEEPVLLIGGMNDRLYRLPSVYFYL